MLFLSSLAAALAPVQQGPSEGGSSTSSTTESATDDVSATETSSDPQLIRQGVDAGQARPLVIRASPGDQLQLRVTSEKPGTVELVGLGPTEDVGPEQPAFFDILLESDGTFPIRILETEREFARIEVREDEEGEEAAFR